MPRAAKGPRLQWDQQRRSWWIRDGSRRRSTGCGHDDRAGAEKALAAYISEKYRPPGDGSPVLVADVLTAYGRAADHRSDATAYAIEHLVKWWGARPVTDVKTSTCRDYVAHRTAQPIAQAVRDPASARRVSVATAARELVVLRAAIIAWHRERPFAALPMVTVPPTPQRRHRWLTRDEAARLLRGTRAIPDPDARRAMIRFILLALYTGSRSGAIRSLAWMPSTAGGWVDLDARIIHRRGDGDRETKKRRPSVAIPDRLLHFLRRWRAADAAAGRAFIVTHRGEAVAEQRRSWARARDAAGLGPDVVPHVLRHTAATWMMHARIPVEDAADYLGMSIEVFWSTYRHAHPDYQRGTAARIGRRP
jgi:integrase